MHDSARQSFSIIKCSLFISMVTDVSSKWFVTSVEGNEWCEYRSHDEQSSFIVTYENGDRRSSLSAFIIRPPICSLWLSLRMMDEGKNKEMPYLFLQHRIDIFLKHIMPKCDYSAENDSRTHALMIIKTMKEIHNAWRWRNEAEQHHIARPCRLII